MLDRKSTKDVAQSRSLSASVSGAPTGLRNLLRNTCRDIWYGVREWCGDSAYERYMQAQRRNTESTAVLSQTEFYVEQLNRKYSRPNRCC
jgi:uncharacterized short protein YbdD (DUF466 family)